MSLGLGFGWWSCGLQVEHVSDDEVEDDDESEDEEEAPNRVLLGI